MAHQQRQQVLIVHSSEGAQAPGYKKNVVEALRCAKLEYQELDLSSMSLPPTLQDFSSIVVVTGCHSQISEDEVQQLTNFVSAGGGLVVTFGNWESPAGNLAGVAEFSGSHPDETVQAANATFEIEFLPGLKGIELEMELAIRQAKLLPDAKTIVRSSENYPIAWSHLIGGGRVLVWQAAFLNSKKSNGLIVASVTQSQTIAVRSIANVGLVHIDDFPAAAAEKCFPPIDEEYGLTLLDFYDQVWLPDMLELADRHNIPYTFLVVFNYNAKIDPPFDFDEWMAGLRVSDTGDESFSLFAARLVREKHELGLPGYNHCPLRLDIWGNESRMLAATQASAARWRDDNLDPAPHTYVPPNNTYDAAGLKAVTTAFPSVRVVAGVLEGNFDKGGDRDIGPEPWAPEIFCIPRNTNGYRKKAISEFWLASQLAMMGVWTHFIHPDDVIDIPDRSTNARRGRNPDCSPWRGDNTGQKDGLYYQFSDWLDSINSRYPWLRFMRTDEAEKILREYLDSELQAFWSLEEISLSTTAGRYFQIHLNGSQTIDPAGIECAELISKQIFTDSTVCTLLASGSRVRIRLTLD